MVRKTFVFYINLDNLNILMNLNSEIFKITSIIVYYDLFKRLLLQGLVKGSYCSIVFPRLFLVCCSRYFRT